MTPRVVLTAGATRNPVDAVRVLTATASGRTAVGLGRALADRGCDIHLLGSPEAALRAEHAGLPAEIYGSTRDLMARMARHVRAHPAAALVHSAAVGDYEAPSEARKLPSGAAELVLRLSPTPKIADHVRGWGLAGPYITFKAAGPGTTDEALVDIARAQRDRTGCDLVFANVLGRLERGVWLVGSEARRFETRQEALAALVDHLVDALREAP
jgi:phosphopantothenoylcysteine synthetase/decarboxylase